MFILSREKRRKALVINDKPKKYLRYFGGFRGSSVMKNLPGNAGDMGLIPGPGRSHMPWDNKPVHQNY